MTKLQPNKPLVRETAVFERTNPLVVELHPRTLEIREKGKHAGYVVSYDVIYDLARKLEAQRTLQARITKRRAS
jgi:hypothetical protein